MSEALRKKKHAERVGRIAEYCAALLLRVKGYRILAWRYRSKVGEIDLIACKGPCLIAVEVKYRKSHRQAIESITAKQQRRIENSLQHFAKKTDRTICSLRFDVITLAPYSLPRHIQSAWRSNARF